MPWVGPGTSTVPRDRWRDRWWHGIRCRLRVVGERTGLRSGWARRMGGASAEAAARPTDGSAQGTSRSAPARGRRRGDPGTGAATTWGGGGRDKDRARQIRHPRLRPPRQEAAGAAHGHGVTEEVRSWLDRHLRPRGSGRPADLWAVGCRPGRLDVTSGPVRAPGGPLVRWRAPPGPVGESRRGGTKARTGPHDGSARRRPTARPWPARRGARAGATAHSTRACSGGAAQERYPRARSGLLGLGRPVRRHEVDAGPGGPRSTLD